MLANLLSDLISGTQKTARRK